MNKIEERRFWEDYSGGKVPFAQERGSELKHLASHIKPGVAHTCNQNAPEMEVGMSEVQGHLQLHNEYEVNLDYMGPCSNIRQVNAWNKQETPEEAG